jgi:hypothetical protein
MMASSASEPPTASATPEYREAEERARRVNELKDRYKLKAAVDI